MNLQLAKKNAAVCKMSHGKKNFFSFLDKRQWGVESAVVHQLINGVGKREFFNSPDKLKGC